MNHALIFSSRTNAWERSSGAHRIATYLRKNGMDVEVVDFTPFWDIELLKEFTRKSVTSKTLFFGFSVFFSSWNNTMKDFSYWLKKEYPHIKTIAGGQSVLQGSLTNIDIWIDSYGEEAILAVAKSLAGNSTAGIKFSPEYFGDKKVIKALDLYPSYNLGDYSVIMEKRDYLESWEWPTIEFSRGCKFSCAFCNFPILGVKEDTSRSTESFEYEMKYNYDTFGIDRYYVADETFNDRVEKITKFANVVESLEFNPFFSGFIRADLLSQPNMIEELARMNFGGQYYGIETFNQESGKVIGKGLDPEKVKQLMLKCKEYFKTNNRLYRGTISLIVGLPFDTRKNWETTMSWLTENWLSEGVIIFPLTVEDLTNSSVQEYTKVSKFSQNLQKYGLRPLGSKEFTRHSDGILVTGYAWKDTNYSRFENLWEHDTMNIFEAKEIAAPLQDKTITDFNVLSWGLSWPEIKLGKKIKDLSQSIDIETGATYPHSGTFDWFIKQYSLKKLNR
jgi:radical SAM superfamily enzyme YgiQ (UPF0313 family)